MEENEIILLETIKSQINQFFKLKLKPARIIAGEISLSRSITATIFLTENDKLFIYFKNDAKNNIREIKQILKKANLNIAKFLPLNNQTDFFNRQASIKFEQTYPGLKPVSENDLIYYKTLIRYDPVLIEIKSIKDDLIKVFDTNAKTNWRPYKKFNYNKVDIK